MGIIRVSAILATTDPIPAYGGIQLAPSVLKGILARIREGRLNLTADHDGRKRLNPKWLHAEIRQTERGSLGVFVELEVEEDEWVKYGRRAFSVAVSEPVTTSSQLNSSPALSVAADASHFDDQTLESAFKALSPHFAVDGRRLFQFSDLPPARVILEMALLTLQVIPINLLSSFLYDGLKHFLRPKRAEKAIIEFGITDERRNRSINARVETNNPEILQSALTQMSTLYLDRPGEDTYEFDDQDQEWRTLRDNMGNG